MHRASADPGRSTVSRRGFMGRSLVAAGGAAVLAPLVSQPSVAEAAYSPFAWEFEVETYGAVGNGTTDDTSAIQDAINAAATYASGHNGFARVLFKDKTYKVAGSIQTGTNGGKGQLLLPDSVITLELQGAGPGLETSIASGITTGTMIKSTSTATYAGSGEVPAVISADRSSSIGSLVVVVRDMEFRMGANPTHTVLNFQWAAKAIVERVAIDVELSGGNIAEPTNAAATALSLPYRLNHASIAGRELVIAGYSCGIKFGEHSDLSNVAVYRCKVGLAPHGTDDHLSTASLVSVQHCPYVISGHSPSSGANSLSGTAYPKILGLTIEDANNAMGGGDWANRVYHVNDPNNNIHGEVSYMRSLWNSGATTGLTNNGASHIQFSDIGGH